MNTILKTISYKNLSNWSVAHLLANDFDYNEEFPLVRIGNFLTRNKTRIEIEDETVYKRVTIRLYNKGVKLRNTEIGKNIGTKKQFLIKKGQFLLSKIDARNGAFGIATDEVDGAIITADFFAYDIDETKIDPLFLVLITTTEQFQKFAQSASSGTTGRQRIDETKFLDVKIPLPTINQQNDLIDKYKKSLDDISKFQTSLDNIEKKISKYLFSELGKKETIIKSDNGLMTFVSFKDLKRWDVWNNQSNSISYKYPTVEFEKCLVKLESTISKVGKKEYMDSGNLPIISQEEKFISGYTDLNLKPIKEDKPLIIYGDHSQTIKYVDFPFIVGADGVRILKTTDEFEPLYFFYFLETIKFETSQKYTRHYKYLKKERIPKPPISKQKEIVDKISNMKEEIKQLKKTIKQKTLQTKLNFNNRIFNEVN
ncbi:restriction endonuclease subunit S [Winogradskyella undariae]|uniref:restriction endonuclease subunit S n=1 Tax=Winogradskyella undariae TaxID=1285465 RepID=UPI0015C81D20|nr:restriction endonuclease subunit S [Winogradskyella undariae]